VFAHSTHVHIHRLLILPLLLLLILLLLLLLPPVIFSFLILPSSASSSSFPLPPYVHVTKHDTLTTWSSYQRDTFNIGPFISVEKAAAGCPKSLSGKVPTEDGAPAAKPGRFDDPEAVWVGAQALLMHRHQWVQQAAARVIGHYLVRPGDIFSPRNRMPFDSRMAES